jgi:thermostable 8-oxoguanine DNA glycosylase
VACRRDGISPTLGMIEKRLMKEFSHILRNVGRAGASVIDRRGVVVR